MPAAATHLHWVAMSETLDEWWAAGTRIEVSGRELFVRQAGPQDGTPVTLLHGFPTSSHDWAPVLGHLVDAGCRVTAPDFLGFGNSDKPRAHRYLLTEQADLLDGLWSELGIGDTALVAHDYGVSVAQEVLARAPGRVTRAAWLNGGLYPDLHRPTRGQRLLRSRIGRVAGHCVFEPTFAAGLREVLGRPVPPDTLHEMWLATQRRQGASLMPRLLAYIDDRVEHADRWRTAFEGFLGPMLFVWGPADPVSGAHMLARIRERLPHAEILELDDVPATGHYPQVENPSAVGPALAGFLTR